jgi:hypothetical protein
VDASNIVALIVGLVGGGGLSALLGYILGGRNELKRDDRAASREIAARRERQADDARMFQRDTLLEIHDRLYKINRMTGRMMHQDRQVFAKTRRYARDQMPDGWSDEHSEVLAQINRLRVRIFDPELRDLIYRYTSLLIRALSPRQRRVDDDDYAVYTMSQKLDDESTLMWADLENQLGAAIRAQFPGSDVAESLVPIDGPVPAEPAPARREQPAT